MIDDALARIRAHELEKVVPMTLCRFFAAAVARRPPRHGQARRALPRVRALRLPARRGRLPRRLARAPRRQARARGRVRRARRLGPAPRRRCARDARAAAALLESDKDRREHQRRRRGHPRRPRAALAASSASRPRPCVRTLRNVHHLWTPIAGDARAPASTSSSLVRALHPTPAVCGTPRDAAFRWIAAHEPTPRGWYAGAVGWFDAAGDGAFSRRHPLRRARRAREAWLYAGAGIVEGSDAALEYAETRVKQAPMLAALGLSP